MNKTRHYIQILLLMLLLLAGGGMANEAWAAKVRYHILTKPFNVLNYNAIGNKWANIRVEALLCESDETTIGLPEQFVSPLATGFRYWAATKPEATNTNVSLYDYGHDTKIINVKYNIYQCTAEDKYACFQGDSIPAGSSAKTYTDIYVTYDYINDGKAVDFRNHILELDGATEYNIGFMNGTVEKFMCFNRSRNNRVANANSAGLSGEDLASDDFVVPTEGIAANQLGWNYSVWGPKGIFAGFMFSGEDPYNITILTSYKGDQLHITDGIQNVDEKKATIKPYAGSSLMAKIGATSLWFDASNDKHYKIFSGCKSEKDWTDERYKELHDEYWKDENANKRYDNWVGFYRSESPTLSSFALLPNKTKGGYMFVGSKLNQNNKQEQPSSGNYYSYYDNYDTESTGKRSQPYFKLQSLSSAYKTDLYEIRKYTIHVKTHGATGETPTTLTATMRWSDARLSDNPADHIPEVLKRKYCSYTAYSDEDCTVPANTFKAIQDAENPEDPSDVADGLNIYLKYTVSESMPFKTLPAGGSYKDAQWYTMRVDGVANPQYVAFKKGEGDDSNNVIVTNGSGNPKGSNTTSQIHQGENSAEAMVAFMGDPYELKILNRKACEDATEPVGNRYIGCATTASVGDGLTTDKTGSSDISKWEIVYESIGETGMLLRQFNTATAASPKYIGLGEAANNKPVTYSATASRIKVVELEKKKYAFHIMRANKSIAVMATTMEEVGKALKGDYTDIPEIIRSPYLSTATVHFYATQGDAEADDDPLKRISNLPYNPDGLKEGVYANIYVRYSFTSAPASATYNVRVNSDYIYIDGEAISSKTSITDDERGYGAYMWTFNFSDPYALTIHNAGNGKYVKISSWDDDIAIGWSATAETASLFIAKSGALPNTREVMAATGDATDASETYYNIGRPSANTVKLYSNSSYLSGNATLRFQLSATGASEVIYHLVDMYNNVLLDATTRQALTENPAFPPEYYSPLVNKYYYHKTLEHAQAPANRTSGDIADDAQIDQTNIWVTYDVNDLVDLKAGQLYLMKYEAGETFNQEDGSDGVNPTPQKAVYPYVNGDCNFFVYGQEQYELQQEGASSTRTRWAWYVESNVEGAPKGDPYHVMIKSRQTESYPITNSSEYNAYFMTYKPNGYDKVITGLGWPGMNSETATEYMVLGSEGQYQLVTTYEIGGSRYVVDSFEQYWKTYDTIRRKLLKQSKDDYPDNDNDPILVPSTPCLVTGFDDNRTYLTTSTEAATPGLEFHSYEKWAYAKRWNGYNNGYSSTEGKHETKKGWEKIEHWFQTVDMGEGYFDFVKTDINPVIILLDQHGWEIMRKPIPTSPDDPQKDIKYAAIRPYNSPMIKEYAFWATAKKRSGFHQYYLLSDRIGGDDFTSTDLTNLPPYGSKNVLDKKGNLNDQYVTYIVKDEYAQTYQPGVTPTAKPFLIEQGTGHKYATTNADGTTLTASDIPNPYSGNMKAYILNGVIQDTEKWYVKPNANIDYEMGYSDSSVPHDWEAKTPNGYEDSRYNTLKTSVYVKETDEYKKGTPTEQKALTDKFGQFSFSNGFDPYNIQIESVGSSANYMKTNANGAELHEGSIIGSYPTTPGAVAMGDNTTTISPAPKWYDSRNLAVTNATYMAVQDAAGNMQLMPRFDHSTRMSEFGTLIAPTDASVATTYTKLYRPEVYEYLIIDNDGKESLRYKAGGDMTPQTPDHFKSPLATNFTYYATANYNSETKTYTNITDKIEESLDGATLNEHNTVYVRYEYNDESDSYNMLKGNWLTMKLNNLDTKYDNGIKEGTSKPTPINSSEKAWQWKFLETPQSTPDPYAVYLYNRSQSKSTKAIDKCFAVLSHTSGGYALAETGLGTVDDYKFLNGDGAMSTDKAAVSSKEAGFTCSAGTFSGTKSQVKFFDDVEHTFTYKVYTNDGVNAIDASQTQEAVIINDWKPVLPEAARTPLLNMDQYRYYEAITDTVGKSLSVLYGLYDDEVFTHYTPYSPDISTYIVPNVKAVENEHVARHMESNDAPIGLNGKRPYNIIWYNDNMMRSSMEGDTGDANDIRNTPNQPLQYTAPYEWIFEGNDPYAIKIKSVGKSTSNEDKKYIHKLSDTATNLDADATTFMLLNKDGYDYGVFAITGDASTKLSGYGNELTTGDPTKFIPFALSTYKVIYHLMIKNIGEHVRIPYKGSETNGNLVESYKIKEGTTLRDLKTRNTSGGEANHIDGDQYQLGFSLKAIDGLDHTTEGALGKRDSIYCDNGGNVSLGDAFKVPQAFYRPNVSYDFYIEGVYDHNTGETPDAAMNALYKGLKRTNLDEDAGLLGKIVFVNIVYNFMGNLDTNSGSDFVKSVDENKWYTFETSDATPMLAEYSGSLQTKSGYATHYTNDYLWTPVGDPYGFKMYNRYIHKNLGGTAQVMSTNRFDNDPDIVMVSDNTEEPYVPYKPANSVYELLSTSTTTPGYFRIHPVANKEGTQVYMRNNSSTGAMSLNAVPTDWTFGLSEDVMKPYKEAAGYVGGLNTTGKAKYDEVLDDEDLTLLGKLMALQDVVYNHDKADDDNDNYIVHYAPGYYRLHSQPGSQGISTPRYASGYTHKIELTAGAEGAGIPMHFYEVEEYDVNNPTFKDLGTAGTDYTLTDATRGDIPLVTVDKDPASIFKFTGEASSATMSTQGLYVYQNKMDENNSTPFKIVDIGGGVVALQNKGNDNVDRFLKYAKNEKKYDLKFDNTASTIESTRWCMKPVQRGNKAGNGEMALKVTTNNGGDENYYTTFYAPFDVLLTDEKDEAFVLPELPDGGWPTTKTTIHLKKIGQYNTAGTYAGKSNFIPARTPVIIRTKNTGGEITMALPTTTPSSEVSCVFTGEYLEQMLDQNSSKYVFTFGRPYTHSNEFTYNGTTGIVTPAGLEVDKGVGFYINASNDRESSATRTMWTRNNKYVYGNKIYYLYSSPSGSRELTRSPEFIPVVFDDNEDEEDEPIEESLRQQVFNGCVYDLQGRCVATEEMVKDGTWRHNLTHGIYILNGKKVYVK